MRIGFNAALVALIVAGLRTLSTASLTAHVVHGCWICLSTVSLFANFNAIWLRRRANRNHWRTVECWSTVGFLALVLAHSILLVGALARSGFGNWNDVTTLGAALIWTAIVVVFSAGRDGVVSRTMKSTSKVN